MKLVVPERTEAQRTEALARANEIRTVRAQLKRDIKARRALVSELLEAKVHPDLRTMKAADLLAAMPFVGPERAAEMLKAAGAASSKTLGGMTVRQRAVLVELAREREQYGHTTAEQVAA